MRRPALLATLIALAFAFCCRAQDEVKVRLDIKGLPPADTLTLSWGAVNKSMNPLIARLRQQGDTLSIPVNEPRLIIIGVKGMEGGYELLASPGEFIEVAGKLHIDYNGKRPRAEFRKVKVKGAQYQPVYNAILTSYVVHLDSLDSNVDQDFRKIKKLIFWAKQRDDEQVIADMYQTRKGQDYIDRVASNFRDKNVFFEHLIASYKDSFLGPMLMLRFGGRLTPEQYPLYESMSPEAQNSYYGREVRDEVAPSLLHGCLAPTVTVSDEQGNDTLLSFANHDSRLLLIDFWASWCQPCIKEINTLLHIYDEYHSQGLDIISISADSYKRDWHAALEALSLPWRNYLDVNQQATAEYGVKYIPSLFIVEPSGTVVAERLRGYELEAFLRDYFAQ